MEIIVFIGVIIGFVVLFSLHGRIQRLERILKDGVPHDVAERTHVVQTASVPQQAGSLSPALYEYIEHQLQQGARSEKIKSDLVGNGWQAIDVEVALTDVMAKMPKNNATSEPLPVDRFFEWLKDDWMLKLGALLLLIGFGWFASYAFLNNWIGPMGRISLGVIAGTLFLILGWVRIKQYLHQGGVFLVLGSTTILLTIFAAREIYDFFTPLSALAVMFLSVVFVAVASVKYNNRALSLASLVLAGIAPLFTSFANLDYVSLFSYLLVVVAGVIWITALTGRRELSMAALILVTFYSLPHFTSSTSADMGVLLLFAYAFATLFFITNAVGILKLKGKEIVPDLVTAASNGLFLLVWIMIAAPDEWKSLIISAWMVVFLVGAYLISKIAQRREPFYVYAGVGLAMLAAATSAELSGPTLAIAYTIESGIISFVVYALLRDIRIAERASLLLIGPMILSVLSITARSWADGFLHQDFFVLLVLGAVLLGLGLFFLRPVREHGDEESRQLNGLLLIAGSIYFYILLWLSLGSIFDNNSIAVMICLTVYTVTGLLTYFYGLAFKKRGLQLYGGVLIGFVVGRLLLVDVWTMELVGRIITFFMIGALLVSTAFLGNKK